MNPGEISREIFDVPVNDAGKSLTVVRSAMHASKELAVVLGAGVSSIATVIRRLSKLEQFVFGSVAVIK
jgi:hypothetical protein